MGLWQDNQNFPLDNLSLLQDNPALWQVIWIRWQDNLAHCVLDRDAGGVLPQDVGEEKHLQHQEGVGEALPKGRSPHHTRALMKTQNQTKTIDKPRQNDF